MTLIPSSYECDRCGVRSGPFPQEWARMIPLGAAMPYHDMAHFCAECTKDILEEGCGGAGGSGDQG